ncbi:MAG: c-type cytochrome [Myxococcales bacterium]
MRAFALVAAFLASGAALADAPVLGDAAHGAALFHAHCASCHGADGRATGTLSGHPAHRPASLRAPSFLATRSDDDLIQAVRKGSSAGMPSFPRFPGLDLWDVLAFLRQGEIAITDFFPSAALFTAKAYTLDENAKGRAEQAIGRPLTAAESTLAVLAFYGQGSGGPQRVGQDPVSLDKLKPREKDGYLVFLDLPRGDGKGSASYGVALAKDGHILRIATKDGPDRGYQPFLGLGHKGQDVLLKPKGKRIPPKVEADFDQAFVRALEAVTMFDKEERDRHWADTN